MNKQPDWNKHSALSGYLNALVAGIVGAAAITITLYTWRHPYNPNSPPTLGLSATFWASLTNWGPPLFCAGCLGASLWVHAKARTIARSIPSVPPPAGAAPQGTKALPSLPARAKEQGPSSDTQAVPHGTRETPEWTEFTVRTEADLIIHIRRLESGPIRGLTLTIENDRLGAIKQAGYVIFSAQSFDQRKGDYRDGMSFNAVRVVDPDMVQAGFSGRSLWFVRKDPTNEFLLAGDAVSPMIWAANDASEIQRWKLQVAVSAMAASKKSAEQPVPLPEFKATLVLDWERTSNQFFIVQEA